MAAMVAAALAGCASSGPKSGPAGGDHGALPFIEDDYPRALAEARKRKVPLFVDGWAPWCHTCRFMRSHVFADRALVRHADRFVWLAVDTDKLQNAGFLEKFPMEFWPTLFVVDPEAERAVLKWSGAATVAQLEKLLDDAELAMGRRSGGPAEEALAGADRLSGTGKNREAADGYRKALELGGESWPRRARTVESLVLALDRAGEKEACAHAAWEHAREIVLGPSFANTVLMGLNCAVYAPKEAPWRVHAMASLEPLGQKALEAPGVLADDVSGIYEALVAVGEARGDAARVKDLGVRWLGFLEGAASRAGNAEARAAFDPHRVSAAIAAGEPGRALPPLLASERELPGDYNGPARLAIVYRELGKLDDAIAAGERALKLVQGPRRIRVLEVQAGIHEKRGDRAAARKTLEQALVYIDTLPASQRPAKGTAERIRTRIAAIPSK
jgi:tetratricopeptide (TPR) repeat protein